MIRMAIETLCPGCGLTMPAGTATAHGYYNGSPECWSVYTEVLGAEYGNAVIFGQVHQRTVDTYAVQHPGGSHPDKSIGIHLCGLHLVLDRGIPPPSVPPMLQRLAERVGTWPHFAPPDTRGGLTVFDVALTAGEPVEHVDMVKRWSAEVWQRWSDYHRAIAELVGG
jgi:hypothetical protein